MKLPLLHPLPLDGSIFSADLRALVEECAGHYVPLEAPEALTDATADALAAAI